MLFINKRFFLLNKTIGLILSLSLIRGSNLERNLSSTTFQFLNTKFKTVKNGESPNRYIWLHGDEMTAKMALNSHIRQFQGVAFFIQNESREIPFKSTMVDPNRIFSRKGSYHALRKFQPKWRSDSLEIALNQIEIEREKLLRKIEPPKNGLLISVHNNFRGYNVNHEIKNSQKTAIKPDQNPRDFILCTDEGDFNKLKDGPYNIVLQNKEPSIDDGSLSWAMLRKNIRYINVETRLGYLTKQKKILNFIENRLNVVNE